MMDPQQSSPRLDYRRLGYDAPPVRIEPTPDGGVNVTFVYPPDSRTGALITLIVAAALAVAGPWVAWRALAHTPIGGFAALVAFLALAPLLIFPFRALRLVRLDIRAIDLLESQLQKAAA